MAVSDLKAGLFIMNAFPGCDLVRALSVCQLAPLKRQKQSGSLPWISGEGVDGGGGRNKGGGGMKEM